MSNTSTVVLLNPGPTHVAGLSTCFDAAKFDVTPVTVGMWVTTMIAVLGTLAAVLSKS